MSHSKYYRYYTIAGLIAKIAELLMYLSAIIFLLNAFCSAVNSWQNWHFILNANSFLLLIINMALIIVSWLNFAARGNKLAGCIDNAYGTRFAQESAKPTYYDNNNVNYPDLKFALNVYESCFFSDALLGKQTLKIVIKNIFIAIIFITAISMEYSRVVMSLLGLFVVMHYLRKLVVFLVVKGSLSETCSTFQSIFNTYQKNGILDMQAVTLCMTNYETAMVWLGTVLSDKIYKKNNKELTEEWMEKQRGLLRSGDSTE